MDGLARRAMDTGGRIGCRRSEGMLVVWTRKAGERRGRFRVWSLFGVSFLVKREQSSILYDLSIHYMHICCAVLPRGFDSIQ